MSTPSTTDLRPLMDRRRFLASSGVAVAAAAAASMGGSWASAAPRDRAVARAPDGRRPNIVIVLADDLGYGEIGAYGQELIQTPNLDRMGGEGIRFTDFYAGGAVCAPSRCTLLTGLHTGHCSVRKNPEGDLEEGSLRPDDVTFGNVLEEVGYRTALFGKWGFGPEEPGNPSWPAERGFGEFFGYIDHRHAHDYYPTHLFDNDGRVEIAENADGQRGAYAPHLFFDRSVEFIERNADEPFLLVFSTNNPHSPNQIPDRGPYAGQPWPDAEKAHAAQVTLIDTQVGQLVDKLEELGIADNTIVLFFGDNGPHDAGGLDPGFFDANGPLRGIKRNIYEGGIRVPMITWAPGWLQGTAGTDSDHQWTTWDVFPTLADLGGAPVPPDLDGRSMRGALTGEAGGLTENEYLYWYRLDPIQTRVSGEADMGRGRSVAEAVRRDDWKAIRFAPGQDRSVPDEQWDVELYDLATDIGESDDVAGQHPDVAAALVALMHDAWVPEPFEREPWSADGLVISPPEQLWPGRTARVTTTFVNVGPGGAVDHVELLLSAPPGWTVQHASTVRTRRVEEGASFEVAWDVTPPAAGAPEDARELTLEASWLAGCIPESGEQQASVAVGPPPPTADSYLSDLAWISASNGFGPVERDMSNGTDAVGDGPPISIRDQVFEKGLGVHAPSEVAYHLGGTCTRFTAVVGIDDFSADRQDRGSVVFQVWGDGVKRYDSGLLVHDSPPEPVDVAVDGVAVLTLVVTDGGNGRSGDNSSWGDAFVIHGGARS